MVRYGNVFMSHTVDLRIKIRKHLVLVQTTKKEWGRIGAKSRGDETSYGSRHSSLNVIPRGSRSTPQKSLVRWLTRGLCKTCVHGGRGWCYSLEQQLCQRCNLTNRVGVKYFRENFVNVFPLTKFSRKMLCLTFVTFTPKGKKLFAKKTKMTNLCNSKCKD